MYMEGSFFFCEILFIALRSLDYVHHILGLKSCCCFYLKLLPSERFFELVCWATRLQLLHVGWLNLLFHLYVHCMCTLRTPSSLLLYCIRNELMLINMFKLWNFRNFLPMRNRMRWSCACRQILLHYTYNHMHNGLKLCARIIAHGYTVSTVIRLY